MSPLELVLERLPSAKQHGTYWQAQCPAHEDKRESLSIREGEEGQVLIKCHAGCTTTAVVEALGLTLAALFPQKEEPLGLRPAKELVACYSYFDERRQLLYQVVRYASKNFRQRRPDGNGGWSWKLDGVQRVLYKLPEVRAAAERGDTVFVVEGEKDADALAALGLTSTTNSGGAGKWRSEYSQILRGAQLVILPDNDEPGRKHAQQVAEACQGIAVSIRIVELPGLPEKGDVSDWLEAGGTKEALLALVEQAVEVSPQKPTETGPVFTKAPQSLRVELLPVEPLTPEMLPQKLRDWILDIAERQSCPIEFVAVSAIIGLGAVVGTQLAIRPKQKDDWTEVPNLWGMLVGPPSAMKSPALREGTKFLRRFDKEAQEEHKDKLHSLLADGFFIEGQIAQTKQKLKAEKVPEEEKRRMADELAELEKQQEKPAMRRYLTNDSTIAKLGEILRDNPRGMCLVRDELIGFLATLDMQGHEADRAFYLEAWAGKNGFTYDRIVRGTVHIPLLCVSILGGIQPEPLGGYLRQCQKMMGRDGFSERFQLAVYPNPVHVSLVDRYPNREAEKQAEELYRTLDVLDYAALGAERDEWSGQWFLRFSPNAQTCFNTWYESLMARLAQGDVSPLLESHLSKYRKLVPALALLFHLAEGESGPVSLAALKRALEWASLLESHARRIYLSLGDSNPEAVQNLAQRLRSNGLASPFTPRQLVRKAWSGLTTTEEVYAALGFLAERGWVELVEVPPSYRGGRPSTQVYVNPAVYDKMIPNPQAGHLQNRQNPVQSEEETF